MKRIIFLFLTLLLTGVGGAKAAEVIVTKVTGTTIVIPPYNAGDTLVVQGAPLEESDWGELGDDDYFRAPWSIRLETGNTVIPNGAFKNYYNMLGFDCPNVTAIGDSAFYVCVSLRKIDCPNVAAIGDSAFFNCIALASIDFSNVTTIGEKAFYNCAALPNIASPTLSTIGSNAFRGCGVLAGIDCPSVTAIGDSAFFNCSQLINIDFPIVATIGKFAFYGCVGLTGIDCPSVMAIGDYAFFGCFNLTGIDCPSVTSISHYAFFSCSALTLLELGTTAPTLGNNVFFNVPNPFLLMVPDKTGYTSIVLSGYPANSKAIQGWTETDPVTLDEGDELLLETDLGDITGITLQWEKDGSAITGATSGSYSVTSVTTADAGEYSVSFTFNGMTFNLDTRQVTVNSEPDPTPEPEPIPAPVIIYHTLTLSVDEGLVVDKRKDAFEIESGNPFSFVLTLAEGYEGQKPVVSVNGKEKGLLEVGVNKWRCIIEAVYADTEVTASFGITGNLSPSAERVFTREGQLIIEAEQPATLFVSSVGGQLFVNRSIPAGLTAIDLPAGIWLVRMNERTHRIVIR